MRELCARGVDGAEADPRAFNPEEYTALRDQWIRYSSVPPSIDPFQAKLTFFCREGEGFILVYSITARATFERIERFRHQIMRVKDSEDIPIVLVGNKSDRVNEREVGKEEGAALAKKLGCAFVETSAKTRSNLEVPYYTVVRESEFGLASFRR